MSEKLDGTSDEFGTPREIFDLLHREFIFSTDAAANHENNLLAHYFTKEHSALEHGWLGRVFCNPPYSRGNVKAFCRKAFDETGNGNCPIAVLLIPTYTERTWLHEIMNSGRVERRFFKKRIQFIGGATGARGNHMLMIFRPPNIWY